MSKLSNFKNDAIQNLEEVNGQFFWGYCGFWCRPARPRFTYSFTRTGNFLNGSYTWTRTGIDDSSISYGGTYSWNATETGFSSSFSWF